MRTARDTVIVALDLARFGDVETGTKLLLNLRNKPECEADAHYGLGLLEKCQDHIESSEAYFQKAISIEPDHADAYYQLAKIADARGDAITAKLYCKSAIAYKPQHERARVALQKHERTITIAPPGARSVQENRCTNQ